MTDGMRQDFVFIREAYGVSVERGVGMKKKRICCRLLLKIMRVPRRVLVDAVFTYETNG